MLAASVQFQFNTCTIKRYYTTIPGVNKLWVLHGEGTMLKSDEVIKTADNTELTIALILDEIASLRAQVKGTLYTDERDELLKRIEKLDSLK